MPDGGITEKDHLRLLAREAHLRSILETIPDAMIVTDERGLVWTDPSGIGGRAFRFTPGDALEDTDG